VIAGSRAALAALLAAALGALLAGCVVDVDLGRSRDATEAPDADPLEPEPEPDPDPDAERDPDAGRDATASDAITTDATTADAIATDAIATDAIATDATIPDALPDVDTPDATPDAGVDPLRCRECVTALAARVEACPAPDCGIGSAALDLCLVDACGLPPVDDCAICPARTERFIQMCRQIAEPGACERIGLLALEDCATRCAEDRCLACLDAALPPAPCAGVPVDGCGDALHARVAACSDVCDADALFGCVDRASARHRLCNGRVAECDAALELHLRACRVAGSEGPCAACPPLRAAEMSSCVAIGFEPARCAARDEAAALGCDARCAGDVITACEAIGRVTTQTCVTVAGPECVPLGQSVASQCLTAAGVAVPPCDDCVTRALVGADACADAPEVCLANVEERLSRCLNACGARGSGGGCLACGFEADRALGRCLVDGGMPVRCLTGRALAETECLGLCGAVRPDALPCDLRARLLDQRCRLDAPLDRTCTAAALRSTDACRFGRGQ